MTRTPRPSHRHPPRLEGLEDRCQLSVIPVTTHLDVVADDGLTSLREALAAAALDHGPTLIKLPVGTYPLSLGQLLIDDPSGKVTIKAFGGPATLDAQGLSRVVEVAGVSDVVFDNLILTGGNEGSLFSRGGGILNGGTLTLKDTTVGGNTAFFGGGISNSGGTLSLIDSTVSGNSAASGGGIDNSFPGGPLTITKSDISNNVAEPRIVFGSSSGGLGGGIFQLEATQDLTISNSTISENTARPGGGGGIYNHFQPLGTQLSIIHCAVNGNTGNGIFSAYGDLVITGSTVSGNRGIGINVNTGYGTISVKDSIVSGNDRGGIHVSFGGYTLILKGTTVSDNTSPGDGAGIYAVGGGVTVTLRDSTVSGNTAGGKGGGLYIDVTDSSVTLRNSVVSGNTASQGGGIYLFSGVLTLLDSLVFGNGPDDIYIFTIP